MAFAEPANLVVGGPQLASLIDIDLASLLSIGLSELLANPKSVQASLEDASLAAEISGTAQAECAGKIDLGFVEHVSIGVIGQIENVVACPICL